MKKLLVLFILMLSVFAFVLPEAFSACTYTDWQDIWTALDWCLWNSDLVNWESVKVKAWGWFWVQVQQWTKNIALYLWVFAVWSVVIGALMLTLSAWEEEKVKKAKDVVKWGLIWFIWIISASAIISLVVRIMYSI